jgi:hypothetical protein
VEKAERTEHPHEVRERSQAKGEENHHAKPLPVRAIHRLLAALAAGQEEPQLAEDDVCQGGDGGEPYDWQVDGVRAGPPSVTVRIQAVLHAEQKSHVGYAAEAARRNAVVVVPRVRIEEEHVLVTARYSRIAVAGEPLITHVNARELNGDVGKQEDLQEKDVVALQTRHRMNLVRRAQRDQRICVLCPQPQILEHAACPRRFIGRHVAPKEQLSLGQPSEHRRPPSGQLETGAALPLIRQLVQPCIHTET